MVGDSFVETTNPPEPIFRRLYGTGEELLGVDRSGRVLGLEGFAFRPEVSGISHADADSLRFLLTPGSVFGAEGRTSAGEFDTIAEVGGRSRLGVKINRDEMIFEGQRMHTNSRTKSPLASEGEAWLFPDGWIAVAHPDPYRVDWRRPDGRWIRGAPLSFTPVKVDEGEKCFAAARRGSDACDLDRYPGWPENVPAFQMDTDPWRRIGPNGIVLRAAPNGMLLINRDGVRRLSGEPLRCRGPERGVAGDHPRAGRPDHRRLRPLVAVRRRKGRHGPPDAEPASLAGRAGGWVGRSEAHGVTLRDAASPSPP